MPITYIPYTRKALQTEICHFQVNDWRIDYLAFSLPENAHKPPLLVVGGAFQNFNSYRYCVERIYADFPVVLIDLPSLGNNDQLAPELGMESMAELLFDFVQFAGWQQVHLMGLSLGSAIAATYAYKYPTRTAKLIVAGIVVRPRKSWQMLVEESVRVLNEARMDPFSQAVVLYLVNYMRLKETGMTSTGRKLFYRQMKRLNDNERERYKVNGMRLVDTSGLLGYPKCETLVTTGEYDSFTLPRENAEFARHCPNGRFVLIENADHLPQLEQRKVSLELFSSFLNGHSLDAVDGIRPVAKPDIPNMERRRCPRYVPVEASARVVNDPTATIGQTNVEPVDIPVTLVDIGFFGCLLEWQGAGFNPEKHIRDCALKLNTPDLQLELIIFEHSSTHLRCLFKHGDVKKTERFVELLKDRQLFAE